MSVNKLVMCPYDEAHKVKESRLQLHITKCRQNNLNANKFICPFNATHVYPIQEKNYHLSNCADRAPLDRRLVPNLDMNNPYKGRTAVPSYSESQPVISDEVWDIDSPPCPGYQPPSEPPANAIFMPPPNSKPSERKRMYQDLHLRPDVAEDKPAQKVSAPIVVKQPKQPSEPFTLQSQMPNFQNLGLGRGRGAPTRIAANIFPQQGRPGNPPSNEASYSAAISSGLSQLGLGRGTISNSSVAQPNAFADDDEFPALGCGRGMSRAPRNTNSYAGIMNTGNQH